MTTDLVMKHKALLGVLGVIVFLLYPFQKTIVPAENVVVINEEGRPFQYATVRQSWKDYSLEFEGHEEDRPTDASGRVQFPARTIRANIFRRIAYPIWVIMRQGVHASFGVHSDVFPLPDATSKPLGNEKVEPQPGEIVFRLH